MLRCPNEASFCPVSVGIRCFIVGADDTGATAVRGSGSVRDGVLPQRRLQVSAADKLSGRAVRGDGVLLGDVGGGEADFQSIDHLPARLSHPVDAIRLTGRAGCRTCCKIGLEFYHWRVSIEFLNISQDHIKEMTLGHRQRRLYMYISLDIVLKSSCNFSILIGVVYRYNRFSLWCNITFLLEIVRSSGFCLNKVTAGQDEVQNGTSPDAIRATIRA